eukprot:1292019-Rhodomonas_salina.1
MSEEGECEPTAPSSRREASVQERTRWPSTSSIASFSRSPATYASPRLERTRESRAESLRWHHACITSSEQGAPVNLGDEEHVLACRFQVAAHPNGQMHSQPPKLV